MRIDVSEDAAQSSPLAKVFQYLCYDGLRDLERPQLNRQSLRTRMRIERDIAKTFLRLINFWSMLIFYLVTKCTYDPTDIVSGVHMNLRRRFELNELENIATHHDVMVYLQKFVETTYTMASALVDANTFNEIDLERCLSSEVSDVCRLKYWTLPLNRKKVNYFNVTSFKRDMLGANNSPSVWECNRHDPKANCIHRSKNTDPLLSRTFGLTPEDPIILDSRMDYVGAFVVPFAPIIWQSLAKTVECDGFGNQYNDEILGAGKCEVDRDCQYDKVTKFYHTQPNLITGRRQSVFVSYKEKAFWCIDRTRYEQEFYDKSWSPWVDFETLTTGEKRKPEFIEGKPIFYKFISDVAYLQRPFATYVHDAGPSFCMERKFRNVTFREKCDDTGSNPRCKDPLLDKSHPMWSELTNRTFFCSYHDLWSRDFLKVESHEWERKRENTFLRYNTNDLTVAALVITPFGKEQRDIFTLVKVIAHFDESGNIDVSNSMVSTAETNSWWYWIASATLVNAFIYLVFSLLDGRASGFLHPLVIFDICQALSTMALVSANVIVDIAPPNVNEEIRKALAKNEYEAYFDCIMKVMRYGELSSSLSFFGFINMIAIFFRLNLYLAAHPRLARLVRTVTDAADDMFHFFFYTIILVVFLCTLSFFSFGANEDEAYITWSQSLWRLFRMFTGDGGGHFPNGDKTPGPKYIVFFMIFWFVIFLILLNFFLAIVVNMYTEVQTASRSLQVDMNFIADYVDIACTKGAALRNGWPSIADLHDYFDIIGIAAGEPSAVTAEELFHNVIAKDGSNAFASLQAAERFVYFYGDKIHHYSEGRVLLESDESRCFAVGEFLQIKELMPGAASSTAA